MALTPQQEQANRKAAQLRKKRGRGTGAKSESLVKPLSLTDIVKKNALHKQFKERQRHDVQRTVADFVRRIRETGAVVIPDDIANFSAIVNGVKSEFRGSDVRWQFIDAGIAFAAPKTLK